MSGNVANSQAHDSLVLSTVSPIIIALWALSGIQVKNSFMHNDCKVIQTLGQQSLNSDLKKSCLNVSFFQHSFCFLINFVNIFIMCAWVRGFKSLDINLGKCTSMWCCFLQSYGYVLSWCQIADIDIAFNISRVIFNYFVFNFHLIELNLNQKLIERNSQILCG